MKTTIKAPYRIRFTVLAVTALFAFLGAVCGLCVSAAAVNGITVSDGKLSRGDSFTVSVTVPAAPTNADAASLRIQFDDSVFEPVVKQGWAKGVGNASSGSGSGYIALSSGNASRAIDLSSDLVISADFTVKSTAPAGKYPFTITKASFSYTEDDGVTISELWEPQVLTAFVDVDDSSGGGQIPDDPEIPDDPDVPVDPQAAPVSGGGLRLSTNAPAPGELFYAYIDIPASDISGDTMSLRTKFDSDVFEVVSWEPDIPASTAVNSGSGYFSVSASSADRNIALRNGITLAAKMRAKSGAAGMTGTFSLVTHSVSRVGDDGVTNTELWSPKTLKVSATVTENVPPADRVKGGGISSSVSSVKRGATFSVYIKVPSIQAYADTASILAEFDPALFDVVSWVPSMPGAVRNSGAGFFSLAASNADKVIDLNGGITLKADLHVKQNAPITTGVISLNKSSLAFVEDNGYDYRELWEPAITSARVSILQADGSGPRPSVPIIPSGTVTQTPAQTAANTTASTTRTTSRTTARTAAPVTVEDSDEDTTEPADDNWEDDPDDGFFDDDPFIDPEPPTDDEYEPEFPDTDENGSGRKGGKRVNVALQQDLSGLGGEKIRIKTKYEFFEHDIIIMITDLPDNDPDAVSALKILGMSGNDIYPFDVSVFDTYTNSYIKALPDGGYIDITVPLPRSMSAYAEDIVLYHIVNGSPAKIYSSIVTEDGVKKITFRLNSFSPFMLVNTVSTAAPEIIMPRDTAAPGSSGVVNPATGAAAAIGIPAVLTGCVFLARKTKIRRKRAVKKEEEEKEED